MHWHLSNVERCIGMYRAGILLECTRWCVEPLACVVIRKTKWRLFPTDPTRCALSRHLTDLSEYPTLKLKDGVLSWKIQKLCWHLFVYFFWSAALKTKATRRILSSKLPRYCSLKSPFWVSNVKPSSMDIKQLGLNEHNLKAFSWFPLFFYPGYSLVCFVGRLHCFCTSHLCRSWELHYSNYSGLLCGEFFFN